jgi:hypothetical protein
VVLGGNIGAVWVRMWSPLLVLGLFAVVVACLASERRRGRGAEVMSAGGAQAALLGDRVEPGWSPRLATAGFRGTGGVLQHRANKGTVDAPTDEHTVGTVVQMPEFWLIWVVMTIVCGSNASTINLLSTIFDDRYTGSLVVDHIAAIIGMVVSALSRMGCGAVISTSPERPIALWLVIVSACVAMAGQLFFATVWAVWEVWTVWAVWALFAGCVAIATSDRACSGNPFQSCLTGSLGWPTRAGFMACWSALAPAASSYSRLACNLLSTARASHRMPKHAMPGRPVSGPTTCAGRATGWVQPRSESTLKILEASRLS